MTASSSLTPPSGARVHIVEVSNRTKLILLNYPLNDGSWEKALAWARENRLFQTRLNSVEYLKTNHPSLHRILGSELIHVIETRSHDWGGGDVASYILFDDENRHWDEQVFVENFGKSHHWFLFNLRSEGG